MPVPNAQEQFRECREAQLAAKVTELRAAGWDVVPRVARDLALSQRDDAREDRAELAAALLGLWGLAGGECRHGVGVDACGGDDDGACEYNVVRAALSRAFAGYDRE